MEAAPTRSALVVIALHVLGSAVLAEEAAAPAALRPLALEPLPLGSIQPEGWLREQLRVQADGLTGHLDEFWPDVRNSGWIGGEAEGWERLPYWLDGLIPLAYELEDPKLEEKAARHVGAILDRQQEDGWLGPEKSATGHYKPRDPWPVFVVLKALTQFHEATGDSRVIPALTRFFRTLDAQLDKRPLFEWNRMRWQDGALSVYWLHARTGESWLLDLARKLQRQGYDWRRHFEDLPFKEKVSKWEHESHVVNNAMGVKAPAVQYRLSGDRNDRSAAISALEVLDRYHGQAAGQFSGDECLAGRMPSQGTETCAIVEYLFSVATLAAVLGDPIFGDRLESLGFNALPAPFKPDMWGRQYVQQANQAVARISDERIWTTNGPDANVYGLETNYGCCTANLHQGWPKLVEHAWMRTPEDGLAVLVYAPLRIRARPKGTPATLEVRTEYPFGEEIGVIVRVERPVRFAVKLRIPSWASDATLAVGDETPRRVSAGAYEVVDREWKEATELNLRLPMRVRVERRYNDAIAVKRGPLVYSLRIGEDWRQVRGEAPHGDWEVYPKTPWNYGLLVDEKDPERSFAFQSRGIRGNPFDPEKAPVRLVAKGRVLTDWGLLQSAAAPPPRSPVTSDRPMETLTLIPYGAAKLRITEFPSLKE